MKLSEFKQILGQYPKKNLRFVLPDGEDIPAHAHVTEVARIDKRFIDCGGTFRTELHCRLQTWVSDDLDHRLNTTKLLGILNQSASFMETEDLEVDLEHEAPVISQFPVTEVELVGSELLVRLSGKNTACLAMDKCKPPTDSISYKPILTFKTSKCC